jgi:hypothetical protein
LAWGKQEKIQRTVRLVVGGHEIDLDMEMESDDNMAPAALQMMINSGGAGVARRVNGERIVIHWSAVATAQLD